MISVDPQLAIDNAAVKKKAAVIDDAFDPVTEGEISYTNFRAFQQVANQEGRLDAVLTRLGIPIPDTSQWDDDSPEYLSFLKSLWEQQNDPELLSLINTQELFFDKISKLEQVNKLCKNIEDHAIEIQRFDSTSLDTEKFKGGEFVYIFLDYRLGTLNGQEAVIRAKNVAKEIYELCPEGKRPVTILMSADPNVDERVKNEFRKDTMLEGVIRFSPKKDLIDKGKISLLIRAYGEELESNHKLQEYIKSLVDAAKEAQEQFAKEVTTLTVEDYEFIQNSVLQKEGQPLGDFLGWLYGSHWAHLLLKNSGLKTKQAEIDLVISKGLPLHHSVPSEKLSDIFMTALFETDLEPLSYHPLVEEIKLPYLHLGDVFTKPESKAVFMILNPQCDLERPSEKNKSQSILLIPGELQLLDFNSKDQDIQTDYFVFEGTMNRIVWNLRHLKSVSYHAFEAWIQEQHLERKYRLRLPFVLDIQQRFTSNMSRVGLPVTPPMSQGIWLEMYLKNHQGDVIPILGKSKEYAFLPITRDSKEKVRFTLNFALDFKAAIIGELEGMQRLRGTLSEPDPKLNTIIEKLEKTIDAFDDWFFQNRSFGYPGVNTQTLNGLSVSSILNCPRDELKDEKKFKTLFIMNIIDVGEEPENEDDAVGGGNEDGNDHPKETLEDRRN